MKKRTNFDDKKINKINFYKSKRLLKLDDIYVNKILVSKKTLWWKNSLKYYIGCIDNDDIRPLCIKAVDKELLKSILRYGKELVVSWI